MWISTKGYPHSINSLASVENETSSESDNDNERNNDFVAQLMYKD